MSGVLVGLDGWSLSRNREGHRTYKARFHVKTTSVNDGPGTVLVTPGLPSIGSTWAYGNDSDSWAFCTPELSIRPIQNKEPNKHWEVEQTFTTEPMDRCQTSSIEDPLNEPDRLSGSFVKYTKEQSQDYNGNPIVNSSYEQIRGSAVEFDENRPSVRVEMNESVLPLTNFAALIDVVNDSTMWGLGARRVKLSNASWSRKLFGTCSYYYVVTYDFDINFLTFDRTILDEGTKVLAPGGTAGNPTHYNIYKDPITGDPTKTILDGAGAAWDGTGSPGYQTIQYYPEGNLLSLGVPSTL